MSDNDLSGRLRRCGITQGELAARCGLVLGTVHSGLKAGRWQYVVIVELLEALPFEQRRIWVETKRGKDSDDE